MKPISINLASRPFYNQTLYLVAFVTSVSILVLMSGLNVYAFFLDQSAWNRFREARDQMQSELQVLDRQATAHARDLKTLNLAQVTESSAFANEAILQRVFSWTLLFNRLEEVMPPSVKLLSIRPRMGDGSIHFRVIGIAKDPTGFLEFEENLLQSRLFSEVYPLSERVSTTGRGIDFGLSFRYLSGEVPEFNDGAPESELVPAPEDAGPEEPQAGATRAAMPNEGVQAPVGKAVEEAVEDDGEGHVEAHVEGNAENDAESAS